MAADLALSQLQLSVPSSNCWQLSNNAPQKRSVSLRRAARAPVRVLAAFHSEDSSSSPRAPTSKLQAAREKIQAAFSGLPLRSRIQKALKDPRDVSANSGGGDGPGGPSGGGGGGGDGHGDDDSAKNRAEALAALAAIGKSLESLPADLAKAVQDGRITGAIIKRYQSLLNSPLLGPLLRFQGFKDRLLADDLFMTKVGIECGVGLFTKTAAEYSKRQDKFFKELDFVIADVIMALIADFMLTWLPAPTVGLSPAISAAAGPVAKFFAACPDNAFQVAIRGTTYTMAQRLGAIVRNGAKLVVVGTGASLAGTAATNGLIALRKGPKDAAEEAGASEHEVPIVKTSLAYGVYMGVSSNLRYQVLAGVVEQRFLEPMLEHNKLALSVLSFIARTGNTFLGSLLWVDYARFVGVQ